MSVRLERDGAVASMVLSNPPLNLFDEAMVAGLEAALDQLDADGVNLLNSCGAQAWQTVFHFHLHVIPRYAGDPLRLPWQPAPGDRDEIAAAARELSA